MKTVVKLLKRVVTLAVVAGIGWYGWGYYQDQQAAEEQQSVGEVPTRPASIRDITVSVSATGTLRPVRIVQVKSKAAGEILNMPAELGDVMQAGDLIAQIDTETLEQEMAQAQADLDSAQIRLKVAERDYGRMQDLQKQDLVSYRDLDNAEQSYTTAKGSLLRAEAEIKLRQERFDDATVRAPSTGTIIAKTVEEGTIIQSSTNSVQGGTTLVEMADLSTLEVRTLVDEIDIGQVRAGLLVQITVEAFPNIQFIGSVIKIEPQAVLSQQVTTFPVLTRIDNADGLLLPGMNADVEVIIHQRPRVLTVPNEAVKNMGEAGQVADLLGLPFDRDNLAAATPTGAGAVGGEALAQGSRPGRPGGGRGRPGQQEAGEGDAAAEDGDAADPASGDGEEELDDGDIDFTKLRGMSAEERTEYMDGFTEDAQKRFRDSMRSRFSGGGGGGPGGGGPGGGGGRGGSGGGGGGPGGGGPGGGGGRGGSGGGAAAAASGNTVGMDAFGIGRREQAVVFVMTADGVMTARQITIGVQDWEYTEVIAGLQAGDEVVILPSTSLLMSQQAMRDRFSRFSRIPGT